jgi:hypothetical protein
LTNQDFQKLLTGKKLDIRKIKHQIGDQKSSCFDVIEIIAECVIHFTQESPKKKFTSKELRGNNFSDKTVRENLGKPTTKNMKSNEYDKFFQQPLKVLTYAGILDEEDGKFSVKNRKVLQMISEQSRAAQQFCAEFAEKYFRDSGLGTQLDDFIAVANDENKATPRKKLNNLRDAHFKVLDKHTPRKKSQTKDAKGKPTGKYAFKGKRKDTNSKRIFWPALKCIAQKNQTRGGYKGRLSKDVILPEDLRYGGEPNFRDKGKKRGETRAQFENRKSKESKQDKFGQREEDRTKERIRERYGSKPQFMEDGISRLGVVVEMHHILPKMDFPKFRAYPENIISVTRDQHGFAHLQKSSSRVNYSAPAEPRYQAKLLICQSFYVEREVDNGGEFYTKESFMDILRVRYNSDFTGQESFDDLREMIIVADQDDIQNMQDTIAEIESISNTPFRNA